jgi:hypothetical protein
MAVYKVAQDVEADDKLIGPFGFRQFIYLIVVAMAGAMAWGLSQIFIPLFIIPVPIMLFFGALALPLRKDQPMETYLAAIVSYYIKPKRRLWKPDGVHSLVEITALKNGDGRGLRTLSERETEKRLSYLADIADTRGWAVRNTAAPAPAGSSMQSDVYNEAQATRDLLDDNERVAQSFDSMIDRAQAQRRQEAVDRIKQAPPRPTSPAPTTVSQLSQDNPFVAMKNSAVADSPDIRFDPYPDSIHQSVIAPLENIAPPFAAPEPSAMPTPTPTTNLSPVSDTVAYSTPENTAPIATPAQLTPVNTGNVASDSTPETTSENNPSPDIINLAHNTTLSVETIAHEAKRLSKKDDQEVLITLR